MIITLIGYMGAGKSIIAKELEKIKKYKKIDLDFEISQKIGMEIPEIFEKRGELFFRKIERELLVKILSEENNIILSTGGGTPCYYDNIDLINKNSVSVYLRTKVMTLAERLIPEKENRPLISKISEENLAEFIGQHLFERNQFYNKASIIVDTDNLTPIEIGAKILKEIEKKYQV